MRNLTLRVTIFLALAAAGTAVVVAQSVTNLRLSPTADGMHASDTFREGTTSLWAVFSYADFSNQRVSATIEGRGITDLATVTQRFSGSGLGSLELSGAVFYRSVAARMILEARAAQEAVNRASTATIGQQESLLQALAAVYSMRSLLEYAGAVRISDVMSSNVATARAATAEVEELLDDALALPASDTAGRQAKAQAARQPAAALSGAVRQIQDGAVSVGTVEIAVSAPDSPYTVQLQIEGMPSSSLDFTIAPDTRILLPYAVRPPAR